MNTSQSFDALRRANPRVSADFEASVDAAAAAVRATVAADVHPIRSRRRLVRVSAGASLAVAGVVAAFVALGSLGSGPAVESASAAFTRAATLTAASAERSGTAVVAMTHDGDEWAGSTIRWNGDDISIARTHPSRDGRLGDEMRVVDGIVYGPDGQGGWLALGSPRNIDPDSGTTPDETFAAVREDVGGTTLRRLTGGMSGLTRVVRDDGSSVYRGLVPAGLVARETGFKGGEAIRVLPFGYVAHDDAADPASPLEVVVTVGPEGVVREIAVTWGTWTYTVTYSGLGTTAAPVAPKNARSLLQERLARAGD